MSTLDTSCYKIVNVKWGTLAYLPDANPESELVGHFEAGTIGEKWNVSKLAEGRYNIRSQGLSSYATCPPRATVGESVVGNSRDKVWIIREARVRGQYT
ncbi:hypothetical protein FRC12_016904 [Ceratobasidium sp. 428]|nr:hypothetical protein FRC12_016904 [Ceratobasidium sp. 428]